MNYEKIWFNLKCADWHNQDTESMWALKLKDGSYVLKNIPVYMYWISLWDMFTVKPNSEWLLFFDNIVKKSWNSTYRLIKSDNVSIEEIVCFLDNLCSLGISYESYEDWLFAINIPFNSDINLIYSKLEEWENNWLFWFEESNFWLRDA